MLGMREHCPVWMLLLNLIKVCTMTSNKVLYINDVTQLRGSHFCDSTFDDQSETGNWLWQREGCVGICLYLGYVIISRGRLVQWETVSLPIQRSGFSSRLRQMILLSRWQKNARHRFIELLFSGTAKAPSTGKTEKRSLHSLSVWRRKRSLQKLALWKKRGL